MGGDGGTVAANRAYLRGAGKANHTADRVRTGGGSGVAKSSHDDDASRTRSILHHCAITGGPLDHIAGGRDDGIVVCPHGKLYRRESAIESLLTRRRSPPSRGSVASDGTGTTMIGNHVRGMKDLHPARFMASCPSGGRGGGGGGGGGGGNGRATLTCPITGSDIGGGNVPCYVIVRSKVVADVECDVGGGEDGGDDGGRRSRDDDIDIGPNVLSERAIKEMGIDGLQQEYGPFEEGDMIRLAPPMSGGIFENIRIKWEGRMESERIARMQKKGKKRKLGRTIDGANNDVDDCARPTPASSSTTTTQPLSSKKRPSSAIVGPALKVDDDDVDARRDGWGYGGGHDVGRRTTMTINTATKAKATRWAKSSSAADEARSTVKSAMANNAVLSDLFGGTKDGGGTRYGDGGVGVQRTEKERRDALFTRNC